MPKVWNQDQHIEELATVIEGRIADERPRVEVCIKGTVLGFPATIEAVGTSFPFGVNFFIVTDVIGENKDYKDGNYLTVTPKVVKGWLGLFSKLLLVDGGNIKVKDRQFDENFTLRSNESHWAKGVLSYPGMMRKIVDLYDASEFSEFHYRDGQGICVVRSECLDKLSVDVARETFRAMGIIAQVIFDSF